MYFLRIFLLLLFFDKDKILLKSTFLSVNDISFIGNYVTLFRLNQNIFVI